MSTYKTCGIIIKRKYFGESSLLLDIYTKDYGKVEAVARSARKEKGKLKGHLEPFLLVELILARGRNIDTITSSLTIESFLKIRENIRLLFPAYYIIELADKTVEEEYRDARIFNLLLKTLYFLDDLGKENLVLDAGRGSENADLKLKLAILVYQIHLVNFLGFSPQLDKCAFCSKPLKSGDNYFSFSMGGILDKDCAFNDPEAIPISDNTIKMLRFFQFRGKNKEDYNLRLKKCFDDLCKVRVDKKLVLDAIFLMNGFVEFSTEREIKGVDFIQ